jgi:hypothetical protein
MNAFYSYRKAHMTLLETLIAISLLSILLVFVFGFFRELSELTRMTEKSQKESFQMRYLESRLGFIFERVVNENDTKRKFFFYTQSPNRNFSSSPSLVLTFNNEVRLDPTFSGDVLGKLYVDKDGRLCLAIWPLHVADPYQYLQEEVLMDHVVNVRYSFYTAPERIKDAKEIVAGEKIDAEKKTPEKDKWHDDWLITYHQMPSIMKIMIEVPKNPEDFQSSHSGRNIETRQLTYHFVLPSSKNYVYYPPGLGT